MRAYIRQLQKATESQSIHTPTPTPAPLESRFVKWFDSLSPLTRQRYFSMSEFEEVLHTQGKYLSPVLLSLGWQRKRVWSDQRYGRYWAPPSLVPTRSA